MNKKVWYDMRNLKNKSTIIPLVFNLNYEYIIIHFNDLEKIKVPQKMNLIVEIDNLQQLQQIPKEHIIWSSSVDIVVSCKEEGYCTALHKQVDNEKDMKTAYEEGVNADNLIISFKDVTNIPLELIIARMQSTKVNIFKIVSTLQDLDISFGVMEHGCEGVVLSTEHIDEITKVSDYMNKLNIGKLVLSKGKVRNVKHIGMGHRACIDTTSMMNINEGMLIGSTSKGGLLISSETHPLPYMNLRPFRVNAGAVHSYVWATDNMTSYLSEIVAGDKLLCVDTDGNTREVSVGRIKIEQRPLLLIEVIVGDININAIVQDDWHIRILSGTGAPLNASTLKIGDELLCYICDTGRHVGIKINESLTEQ